MPLPTGVFLSLGTVSVLGGIAAALTAFNASSGVSGVACLLVGAVLGVGGWFMPRDRGLDEARSSLAIIGALLGATGLFLEAVTLGHSTAAAELGALLGVVAFGVACTGIAVWFPSAVAGAAALSAVSLSAAVIVLLIGGNGFDIAVTTACVGLLVGLLVPSVAPLTRHPAGARWLLGAAAPLILLPDTVLVSSGNVPGVLSGLIAGAGLIAAALRYRSLPMALASVVPLTAVEIELVVKLSANNASPRWTAILVVLIGSAQLGGVALIGGLRQLRGRLNWPLPGAPQQALFAAALCFAVLSVATPGRDLPAVTPQLAMLTGGATVAWPGSTPSADPSLADGVPAEPTPFPQPSLSVPTFPTLPGYATPAPTPSPTLLLTPTWSPAPTASAQPTVAPTPRPTSLPTATPTPTPTATPAPCASAFACTIQSDLFALINQDRTSNGVPQLEWNGTLADIADGRPYTCSGGIAHGRALDMVQRNYYDYAIPECGGQFSSIMFTPNGVTWTSFGENIHFLTPSDPNDAAGIAQALNTAYMSSAPQRANILNASFKQVGIGDETAASFQGSSNVVVNAIEFIAQ